MSYDLSRARFRSHVTLSSSKETVQATASTLWRHQRRVVNPFADFPDSLLQKIFCFCLPPDIDHADLKDVFLPYTLGAVCKSWRTVVRGMPPFWTNIVIRQESFRLSPPVRYPEIVRDFIGRSQTLPIKIFIYGMDWVKPQDLPTTHNVCPPAQFCQLLDVIAISSSRWKYVWLEMDSHFLAYLANKFRVSRSSNLNFVHIRSTPIGTIPNAQTLPLFTPRSFQPSQVSLRCYPPSKVAANGHWANVTHVRMEDIDVMEVITFLQHTRSALTHCKFININRFQGSRAQCSLPQNTRLSVLSVKNLELDFRYPSTTFFDRIRFPNLEDLSLCLSEEVYSGNLRPSILEFLGAFSLSLTMLRLLETPPCFADLQDILIKTPSVTDLYLQDSLRHPVKMEGVWQLRQDLIISPLLICLASTATVSTSSNSDSSQVFLPKLQRLDISLGYTFHWSEKVIDIFGPPAELWEPNHRPLTSFSVTDSVHEQQQERKKDQEQERRKGKKPKLEDIEQQLRHSAMRVVVLKSLLLQRAGAEITYTNQNGRDLLAAMRERYGC
ncbi:hypothetical protein D9613_004529 [Agrocybe pediades]|uniref:F-box domain-containing protein n=1 Tax=Agrocybe pediades TaxID=84607 RepID=A0A8H4QJN2_9AGAR|nr:hypothetical protein D9613_004529 [Agrocybe pediades]